MRGLCGNPPEVKMKIRRLRIASSPKLPVALGCFSSFHCFVVCVAGLPRCSNLVVKTLVSISSTKVL
uniref:Uncharacterized protein n=1 Tax=Arundo donax TaxID=35708 RepID=A0A0A8ZJ85_ARUDO